MGRSIQSAKSSAITESGSLTDARSGLENESGERFWDWMVGTQSL